MGDNQNANPYGNGVENLNMYQSGGNKRTNMLHLTADDAGTATEKVGKSKLSNYDSSLTPNVGVKKQGTFLSKNPS